jgi:hypothetical protein
MKGDDFADLQSSESPEFTSSRLQSTSVKVPITHFAQLGLIVPSRSILHQSEIGTFAQSRVDVEKH